MTHTEKLLTALQPHLVCEVGSVSQHNGSTYRYDRYTLKYPHTAPYLAKLFSLAAAENGKQYDRQFTWNGHSFHFDRANFKGQRDGKISFTKLITL
jgi:hypothetical protein